jgi:hypothetical protein
MNPNEPPLSPVQDEEKKETIPNFESQHAKSGIRSIKDMFKILKIEDQKTN